MSVSWTTDQQKVIDTRNQNILVSAAAGSGKTAVLVERIITLLTDKQNPLDIDRFLMVTFTNAAAAEMKERIGKGIDEIIEQDPDNLFLRRQKLYLSCAQISTIHSLCQRLIREHFDVLELDPSFRMGDETEIKLMMSDIAKEIMETYYQSESASFRAFVDRYSKGKTDEGIEEMIIRIYNFSRGYVWPEYWLDKCITNYDIDDRALQNHPIIQFALQKMHRLIEQSYAFLQKAINICQGENGPIEYIQTLEQDRLIINEIACMTLYSDVQEYLAGLKWATLARKAKTSDKQMADDVKQIRDTLKKEWQSLQKDFFGQNTEHLMKEMRYIKPSVEMLIELVKSFSFEFQEKKKQENIMDFSDLEHYALQLLISFQKDENGEMILTPTKTADLLSSYYQEVICDEYQDSNMVQEIILETLSGNRFGRHNRLMVGDVKQSIYRFRLADSEIFMEKYNDYHTNNHNGSLAIDLHQNFRSRETVLAGINAIFEKIMVCELGGILYDDIAALHPGMIYPEKEEGHPDEKIEIALIEHNEALLDNEDQELTKTELEARYIAHRIKELTDSTSGIDIYDSKLGQYRKAVYSDIVILLRAVSGKAEVYVQELETSGIPANAELSQGFFDTIEIRTMVELLTIINNPRQDISLAAVLVSPIGSFKNEELAWIRSNTKKSSLFTACKKYHGQKEIEHKLQIFLDKLENMRRASEYMDIYELLQYIFKLTNYYEYVQAMPSGKRRKANLDLLVDKAVAYASGSMCGLYNFIRYIEQLKKNEIDFGEAPLSDESLGRVSVMSIHKSKGLEYPIVFVAELSKNFNQQDMKQTVAMHSAYGLGLDAVNLHPRRKLAASYKRFINQQVKLDSLAEELRILYVALTRAKEKLILTGTIKDRSQSMSNWQIEGLDGKNTMPLYYLEKSTNYLDWIIPCIITRHKQVEDDPLFQLKEISTENIIFDTISDTVEEKSIKDNLLKILQEQVLTHNSVIEKALQFDNNWLYPRWELLGIKGKYSVSELKISDDMTAEHLIPVHTPQDEQLPDFMKKTTHKSLKSSSLNGALRGTAYHRVLELLDFADPELKHTLKWVNQQMQKMTDSGKLTELQKQSINPKDILHFISSELGQRICKAAQQNLLYRETQFVMAVPVSMISTLYNTNESVLVQGIIDNYFIENDEVILIDYKTDYIAFGKEEEFKQKYIKQIDYYQYAIEKMTGKTIKERMLYSFYLEKEIII